MNIFKILSSNDGSINEPNVSSFLAYLLDPNENHGLGSTFVERFLTPIIMHDDVRFKELIYDNRVRDLSRNSMYEVRVQAEVKVISSEEDNGRKRTRDIDILIEIMERQAQHSVPKYVFGIENKIKDGAISKGDNQLYDEIVGLKRYYAQAAVDSFNPLISFIFLTPTQSRKAEGEYQELLHQLEAQQLELPCMHMRWGVHKDSVAPQSVARLLSELLSQEGEGRIEPIYEYTKHTIKSFVSFIYSDFQSYKEEKNRSNEKLDYGKPVIQYIRDFFDRTELGVNIAHDDLKKWVTEAILQASNHKVNPANFDHSYVINDRNRRHYGVNSPDKAEKNLFYYPDESNRKVIRKLDNTNPPAGVNIYWRDPDGIDGMGVALYSEYIRT
ncbi:PD-(D/E)XK nuclease family protein [Paenibacillus kobensis]|uniref:PD-(D/E)XK nuclease family protein n=1 Tax=Paenibacillus kobensis TaxID=59841 RepID=UPI000FD789BC|nr:PD-(D/E)XK nuclease family protein [Paenibacillus kobensis]